MAIMTMPEIQRVALDDQERDAITAQHAHQVTCAEYDEGDAVPTQSNF